MNKGLLLASSIITILVTIIAAFGSLIVFIISSAITPEYRYNPSPYDYYTNVENINAIKTMLNVIAVVILVFVVLNIVAVVKLMAARNDRASKQAALGWSIYLIFGAGLIAGVLGIMGATAKGDTQVTTSSSLEQQLKELDNLFNKGLITQEEYTTRRSNIINRV